jgi:transcriptional regulator with PAS, ATPase and Fis domain
MEDLPALVRYLLNDMGAHESVVTDEVMKMLKSYSWPGNIRELKNILERALLLTPRGAILRMAHFSILENNRRTPIKSSSSPAQQTVQEMEKSHILSVLDQMGGDIDKAAKSLNLSRATVYRRLKQIKDTSS